jgi:hypothetical protein
MMQVLFDILTEFGVSTNIVRLINEMYSKVCIGKLLSYNFPIENYIKQKYALLPLIFNFALEYAIRKAQESQMRLKLNWTHKFLDNAGDMNLLADNIEIIKKKREMLLMLVRRFL